MTPDDRSKRDAILADYCRRKRRVAFALRLAEVGCVLSVAGVFAILVAVALLR